MEEKSDSNSVLAENVEINFNEAMENFSIILGAAVAQDYPMSIVSKALYGTLDLFRNS